MVKIKNYTELSNLKRQLVLLYGLQFRSNTYDKVKFIENAKFIIKSQIGNLDINSSSMDVLNTAGSMLDVVRYVDSLIDNVISDFLEKYRSFTINKKSVVYLVSKSIPTVIEYECYSDIESGLREAKNYLINTIKPYVDKGISKSYFINFSDDIDNCGSFKDLYKLIFRIIENSIKKIEEKRIN